MFAALRACERLCAQCFYERCKKDVNAGNVERRIEFFRFTRVCAQCRLESNLQERQLRTMLPQGEMSSTRIRTKKRQQHGQANFFEQHTQF